MEKEKLSEQLKSAVGTTSMSDKSWSDYLENVVIPFIPEDEGKQAEYISKHAAYLKSQSGQYNKDIADKVNEFKKNYKPDANPPVDGKPKDTDDVPKWAESLLEKVTQFEANQTKAEKKAILDKNISEAKSKLQSSGADNASVLNLAFRLIDLTGEESVDDIMTKAKVEYDKQVSELYRDGYTPHSSHGGGQPSNFAAYKAQKQKEGKLPS